MNTVLPGIFVLLVLAIAVVASSRGSRRTSPRQIRRLHRERLILLPPFLILPVLVAVYTGANPLAASNPLRFVTLVILMNAVLSGWSAFRPWRDDELNRQYTSEPGRCPKCEYDLTGNVSGVCPECAWQIPAQPMRIDSPGWAFWWRQWRIDSLENWKRTCWQVAFIAILCFGVAAWFWAKIHQPAMSLFACLMGTHMLVNLIRVAQYARTQN
jgi:hypothetical protein